MDVSAFTGSRKGSQERLEDMIPKMAKQAGITEELKVKDNITQVGAMNNIRNSAEEIVLKELVYEQK